MSYSDIVTNIKNLLDAVSGIENVYTYRIHQAGEQNWSYIKDSSNFVNTWQIVRPERPGNFFSANGATDYTDIINIEAYYSVDSAGATELTFQGLIDDAIAALNIQDQTFGGFVDSIESPPQLISLDYDPEYMGILCHKAVIQMKLIRQVNPC